MTKKGFQGFVDTNGYRVSTDHDAMLERMKKLVDPPKKVDNKPQTNYLFSGSTGNNVTTYINPQPTPDKPKNKVIFNIEKLS
jgi:hypothetical protein